MILGCLARIGSFVGFEIYVGGLDRKSESEFNDAPATTKSDNKGMECPTFFKPGHGNLWETTFDISTYFFFSAYCIVLCSLAEIYYHTKDSISQQRASVIRAIQNANRFETVKDEKVDKRSTKIVTTVCIVGIFVLYLISICVVYFLGKEGETYSRLRQIPLYVKNHYI